MARVGRVLSLPTRLPRLSERARLLLPPVIGIVTGVLLIVTGLALLQFIGAAAIGLALVLARGWMRLPDVWWTDPGGQLALARGAVRRRIPVWPWQGTVAAVIGIAAVVLLQRLLTRDGLGPGTLGDLGKGAIALAMMATLALWGADRLPGWPGRRGPQRDEPGADVPG